MDVLKARCALGLVAALLAGHALAGDLPAKAKDPNDGMVFVRGVGWVYPDSRCVNGRVYVHGRPTESVGFVSVDRKMHVCGPPEVVAPICDGDCSKPKGR